MCISSNICRLGSITKCIMPISRLKISCKLVWVKPGLTYGCITCYTLDTHSLCGTHQLYYFTETCSALRTLCDWNTFVTGWFSSQRPGDCSNFMFFCGLLEQAVEKLTEWLVSWVIMILMWFHTTVLQQSTKHTEPNFLSTHAHVHCRNNIIQRVFNSSN